MAGMRDRLIHQYFGVNLNIIWTTTVDIIPEIHFQIKEILESNQ
ncbi:DUF86 domain-containing protein [Aquimarina sp. U1-2]|nr:DUF86 domain-containing protein [Aquimarina sp. U1-2]